MAHSEDSDQTGRMHRLIRVFAGRTLVNFVGFVMLRLMCQKIKTFYHLSWGRGIRSVCFSCICLFVLYGLVFVIFSSSWCLGLAVVCDCGTPWTFLLTVLKASNQTVGKTIEFIFFF